MPMLCAHALAQRTVAHFALVVDVVQRLEPGNAQVSLLLVHLCDFGKVQGSMTGSRKLSCRADMYCRGLQCCRLSTSVQSNPPCANGRTFCTSSNVMACMPGPTGGMASQVSTGASTLASISVGRMHCDVARRLLRG